MRRVKTFILRFSSVLSDSLVFHFFFVVQEEKNLQTRRMRNETKDGGSNRWRRGENRSRNSKLSEETSSLSSVCVTCSVLSLFSQLETSFCSRTQYIFTSTILLLLLLGRPGRVRERVSLQTKWSIIKSKNQNEDLMNSKREREVSCFNWIIRFDSSRATRPAHPRVAHLVNSIPLSWFLIQFPRHTSAAELLAELIRGKMMKMWKKGKISRSKEIFTFSSTLSLVASSLLFRVFSSRRSRTNTHFTFPIGALTPLRWWKLDKCADANFTSLSQCVEEF